MNDDYTKEFLGRGIRFPFSIEESSGRIRMSAYEEDIEEAIRIILMTRKKERIMRPEFGCDIHDYVFSVIDYTTLSQMETCVEQALIEWEPRISNIEVKIDRSADEGGLLLINIHYTVRSTKNPYNLVYPFYVNEGIEI